MIFTKRLIMELIFATDPIPTRIIHSLFLAGPSPRAKDVHDWRVEALAILEKLNFTGTVFIPIPRGKFYGEDDDPSWTYLNQINWECEARAVADKIIFWLDRNIEGKMPGFTTNVEFGEDLHSGKMIYGRPQKAEKNRYLDKRYLENLANPKNKNGEIFNDLEEMLIYTKNSLGVGALRTEGEVYVPLFVWNSEQFQSWYKNLLFSGNRLEKAQVKHFFMLPNGMLFSFSLWVKVWIEKEKRYKENETIFSRKDISSVVAFHSTGNETFIVLIQEFRSPVNNQEGYVYELPSGSSSNMKTNPLENAQHELHEETGLYIDSLERFHWVGTRQLAATLSTHLAQVYAVELTEKEFNDLSHTSKQNLSFGVNEDSEKTWVEVMPLSQINQYFLDWSMIGMIYEAIRLR